MTSRVDMHCHSTASQLSRLGVQRSLGLPECATPPEEVYELAKRRGMDFVTITDHDTIDGCLELADRPDCFVSEELTARFAGEPQAVHVLCYGITPGDHEWLQAHAGDVEACAAYLAENEIACALAHPFFNVDAPLTPRHRRRLAELFPIWEVRNGSRAAELNMPAAIYIETHGGTGIGGSDDHAGVDIGRTFTEVPAAATPEEFLHQIRAGDAQGGGQQGSAAKWAHAAMALATRALGGSGAERAPDPAAVLKIAQRTISEGAAREGKVAADIGPDDARALLEAWLRSLGLEQRGPELIAYLQAEDFSHADLYRRARRTHERRLRGAIAGGTEAAREGDCRCGGRRPLRGGDPGGALRAGDRLPRRREGEAGEPAGGATADRPDRRRDRRHPRRHHDDREDPRARRAGLRDRGGRHRRRRRPAPAGRGRAGDSLLRGHEPRRSRPARSGRDAGRGSLRRRSRHRSGSGRRRGDAAQPDRRHAADRQLPHRAGQLRGPAQRRRRGRGPGQRRARRLLRCALAGPLAEPRGGSFAAGARRRVGAPRPLGARRRRRTLRSRQGRARGLPRRGQGPLRRPPHPREGRRPARRELPARPRGRPAAAPAARRRRSRGGRAARTPRRARDLPRLARGRGAGARLRQRRRLPLLLDHRHLRAGRARGRRQRRAGRRRRRGRSGLAGREPPHRHALPGRRRPHRRHGPAAGRLAAAAPPPRRLRRPRLA